MILKVQFMSSLPKKVDHSVGPQHFKGMDLIHKRKKLEKFRDFYLDLIILKDSAKDLKTKANTLTKSQISSLIYIGNLIFFGKIIVPKSLYNQIYRKIHFRQLEKIFINKDTKSLYDRKNLQKFLPIFCQLLEVLI